MTPRDLIAAFETLADAPDGVKRLRELVLQLAVRGKLVAQDPGDEPASKIIEHAQRAASGRAGRFPALPALDLLPLLPNGWLWIRLGMVLQEIQAGWSPEAEKRPKEQNEWGVLKVSACSWGKFRPEENKALLPGTEPRVDLEVKPGDFLISRANTIDLVARSVVVGATPPGLMLSDKTLRLVPVRNVDARYLNLANSGDTARRHYTENATGTSDSMRNVSQEAIRCVPIPLPPLAEQRRIVARVDELMGLLDRLEAARTARDEVRRAARDAALAALRDAEDAEAVEAAWARVSGQMDALFTASEDVAPLRKVIRRLAVCGRLVQSQTHAIVKVKDVVQFLNGYGFKSEWYSNDGIRLVRNQNVAHGTLDWSDVKFIPESRLNEFRRFQLEVGDIVLSLDRPLISTGLKVAVIREDDAPCLLLQRVACPRPKDARIDRAYFLLWLTSPEFTDTIEPGRSNGVPHIFTKTVEEMEIRLPSIEEQHRIGAKVDALMALCDQLEARLTAARELQAQFAAAAVHHLDV